MLQRILATAATIAALSSSAPPADAAFFGLTGGIGRLSTGDCRALSGKLGPERVWFSQFSGYKPNPWDTGLWHGWGIGCFATHAECKRWLYDTQTEWPQLMDFTFCKQGVPQHWR